MKNFTSFLDEKSFIPFQTSSFSNSITTGYGTVNNDLVFLYECKGVFDVKQAVKISDLYTKASQMGAPVISFIDCDGINIEEDISIFDAYSLIFGQKQKLDGIIPQITVVTGKAIGLMSIFVNMSDFVFMKKDGAELFLNSKNVFKDGKYVFENDFYSSKYHSKNTGIVDIVYNSQDDLNLSLREIIRYLPQNNMDENLGQCFDDLNRSDASLDLKNFEQIIESISDDNNFLELKKEFSKNSIICFCKLNGKTVGIIAICDLISNNDLEKINKFVVFCNNFKIPIVTFTNFTKYDTNSQEDHKILTNLSKLAKIYYLCNIPKINIIVKEAVGSGYFINNSKHLGADIVLAWENSKLGIISEKISNQFFDVDKINSCSHVAQKGFVDQIIKPCYTRKYILAYLEILMRKNFETSKNKLNLFL